MDSKMKETLKFLFCMALGMGLCACIMNGTLAMVEGERIGSTWISNVPWSEEAYIRIAYTLISGIAGFAGLVGLGELCQKTNNE